MGSEIKLKPGNLNKVELYQGINNQLFVHRRPQSPEKIAETMNQVMAEFSIEKFLDNPVSGVRLRSAEEQAELARQLQAQAIPTPTIYPFGENEQKIEYIPHTDSLYNLWLQRSNLASIATPTLLEAIILAHTHNIIPGDRTGKNDLVKPDGSVILIDFDIEMYGPDVKEFEFANLIFRLSRAVHRGGIDQLSLFHEICSYALINSTTRQLYNSRILKKYFSRFAELSTPDGAKQLVGMTPLIDPIHSAVFFQSLTDMVQS